MVGRKLGTELHKLTKLSSVTGALSSSLPVGINPFWKLSFVFKCLTDSVVLDDFKTALDRLRAFKISHFGSFAAENGETGHRAPPLDPGDGWSGSHGRNTASKPMPSSDGDDLSHPGPWSNGKPHRRPPEVPKRSNREVSYITESSSEAEVAGNASRSPTIRPQSSWLRDSTEVDYAQAVREVTRSSHSDQHQTEKDVEIGRAR